MLAHASARHVSADAQPIENAVVWVRCDDFTKTPESVAPVGRTPHAHRLI
jgi:hypothetical protein